MSDLACPSLGTLRTRTRTSVLGIPTGDTHITGDMRAGIHISREYTYHCDTGLTFRIRSELLEFGVSFWN